MKNEHRSFSQDNTIVKQKFNYLKYINGTQTITWVMYFNENDICRATKKICDFSIYDSVIEEMDEKYATVSENIWEFTDDYENTFIVTLKEEEWYFTLRETGKEK